MALFDTLSRNIRQTRHRVLSQIDPDDYAWAIPIMRMGYGGRALVYLVVAGLSLWSLMQGGEAQGTAQAFQSLSGGVGTAIIVAIVAGMVAYALWRVIDSLRDLEAYGTTPQGLIARAGMIVTGLLHLGVGVLAANAIGVVSSGGGGKSTLVQILSHPIGRWSVGIAGALTIAAAIYYFHKALTRDYREKLAPNPVARRADWALRIGVAAQGLLVGFIGGLLIYAARQGDAYEVGGLDRLFDWLDEQAQGEILVIAMCLGLLAFALFCATNAIWRVVPKASGDGAQTMADAD